MSKTQVSAVRRNDKLIWAVFFFALVLFFLSASKAFAGNAAFILEPKNRTLSAGDDLTLTVSLDTGEGSKTNSYIASLSYPKDQLEFVSIDTSTSPFNMALESKGGDGKVTIMRGTTESKTGKVLVGTVNFKAKASTSSDAVKVSNDSAIISSSDNTNILPGSTVQNSSNKGMSMDGHQMDGMGQKPSGIMGIFQWIKNFFASWFK